MKKHVFVLINLAASLFSYSQNWAPLSTGLSDMGGNGSAYCMAVYNNKLIVGGRFISAGGLNTGHIAAWDGVNWSTVGTGFSNNDINVHCGSMICAGSTGAGGQFGNVNALQVYNNELYAAGCFRDAGGVPVYDIAKWNGSVWSDVGGGNKDYISGLHLTSLAVYNNELYVGGQFDSIGGIKASGIAKWNGTNWSSVGGSLNKYGMVTSLCVYNSELYVGGQFDTTGTIPANNIAKWNGSIWSTLGGGINTPGGQGIFGLIGYNGSVYAGNFTTGISSWNGSNWQTVGGGLVSAGVGAFSMLVFNGKLIVGGSFIQAGLLQYPSNIAAWDGTQWSYVGTDFLGGGVVGLADCVSSLCIFQNQLYAGGGFSLEENETVFLNGIARFTGTVGLKENSLTSKKVSVYPNPTNKYLSIKTSDSVSEIEITSVLGSSIMNGDTTELIDVSELNSGVYFIKLFDKDKLLIGSQKFIKE